MKGATMDKIIKLAEIDATDVESLKEIVGALEKANYTIVYDKEFESRAYICVTYQTMTR